MLPCYSGNNNNNNNNNIIIDDDDDDEERTTITRTSSRRNVVRYLILFIYSIYFYFFYSSYNIFFILIFIYLYIFFLLFFFQCIKRKRLRDLITSEDDSENTGDERLVIRNETLKVTMIDLEGFDDSLTDNSMTGDNPKVKELPITGQSTIKCVEEVQEDPTMSDSQKTLSDLVLTIPTLSNSNIQREILLSTIQDSPSSPTINHGFIQKIVDLHGHRLSNRISSFASNCLCYKLIGSIFLFVSPTFSDGVRLYHIKDQVLPFSPNDIETIVFTLQKVIDMYIGGRYQGYKGQVFRLLLGSSVKIEVYLSFDTVFISNSICFKVEMKMTDFVDLYHELVRYRRMFPNVTEFEFPCMFSHKDRVESRECSRCNGYFGRA